MRRGPIVFFAVRSGSAKVGLRAERRYNIHACHSHVVTTSFLFDHNGRHDFDCAFLDLLSFASLTAPSRTHQHRWTKMY